MAGRRADEATTDEGTENDVPASETEANGDRTETDGDKAHSGTTDMTDAPAPIISVIADTSSEGQAKEEPSATSDIGSAAVGSSLAVEQEAQTRSSTAIILEIPMNAEVGAQLASVPILSALSSVQRNKLGGALVEKTFAPDSVVFTEGDDSDQFYIIKEGDAVVSKGGDVICQLVQGDYFGEQAIIKNTKRDATVKALGELKLWIMNGDKFQVLFKEDRINVNFLDRGAAGGRGAVAAETAGRGSIDASKPKGSVPEPLPVVDMSEASQQLVLKAVQESLLFQHLDADHKALVVSVMPLMEVKAGTTIIKEGDQGNTFYVIEEGRFEVLKYDEEMKKDRSVDFKEVGSSFGELALMYDAPRNASVVALVDSKLRVLQRTLFNRVVREAREEQVQQWADWLKKVQLLKPLTNSERCRLVEALDVMDFPSGSMICKEGDAGDAMYVIVQGKIKFTQKNEQGEEKDLEGPRAVIGAGSYFGERALLNDAPRAVSAIACAQTRLLRVDREAFEMLLGPLQDILKANEKRFEQEEESQPWNPLNIPFDTLKQKQVLGSGSYGYVTLVEDDKNTLYALKAVSKQRVVDTHQKEHIFNEKNLMTKLDHPFLIKLYATYKDQNRLYFLLEAARVRSIHVYFLTSALTCMTPPHRVCLVRFGHNSGNALL